MRPSIYINNNESVIFADKRSSLKAIQSKTQQIAQLLSHYLKNGKYSQSPLYKALRKVLQSYYKTFRGHFLFYILPIPTIQKAFRQSPSPEKQILQGYTDVSASQYALPYQSGHCV